VPAHAPWSDRHPLADSNQMTQPTTRRRAVVAGVVGLLGATTAGCTELLGIQGPTPYDLYVHNETGVQQRVAVTISDVDGDDSPETEDTTTVDPGDERQYNNASRSGRDVAVEVDVVGGCSATTVWRDPDAAFHVRVRETGIAMRETTE